MSNRKYSPAMEAAARQQGFSSAEQMDLFYKQRSRPTGGTTQGKKAPPSVETAMSWHPKSIFEYLVKAMTGANNR